MTVRWCGVGAALLLTACGGGRERPAEVRGEPERPPIRETARCHADLVREGVDFRPLPDRDFGGGCAVAGAVQLTDIGVPVTGITAMRCGNARAFAAWVRNAVAPAAYQVLGSELARVQGMGTYSCRNVAGTNRRSGHAQANAVDVGGFTLKDGRRVTILNDWRSEDPQVAEFLRLIRRSACKRFGTVLTPDYNAAHRDHLHLEDDGARFCR